MIKRLILLTLIAFSPFILKGNDNICCVVTKGSLTAATATVTALGTAGMVYCLYDIAGHSQPDDILEPLRVVCLSIAAAGCGAVATISGCGTCISGISLRSAIKKLLYLPKEKCDV